MEGPIFFFVVSWLWCKTVDFTVALGGGAPLFGLILKWIVVVVCLILVLFRQYRHGIGPIW